MSDIKLGETTYHGVDAVSLPTPDGGTAKFLAPDDLLPQPDAPQAGGLLRVVSVSAGGKVTALETISNEDVEVLWEGTMIFEPTAVGTPPKYVEHIWSDHEPPAQMFHEGERILFTVNGAAKIYTVRRDDLGSVYFGNRYLSFDQIEGEGDTGDDFSVTIWLEDPGFQYVCFARTPGTYQVRIERITAQADAVTLEAAKEYADTKTAEALEQAREYTNSQQKTTLEQAKAYTDSKQPGSGPSSEVQPDWNQNDPGAIDYIKNRICYVEDTVVNIKELLDNGAPTYGNYPKLVQVSDYVPFGDWIYYIEIAGSSQNYKYLSALYESSGTEEYMVFTDVVDTPCAFLYVGKNGVSTASAMYGITEPGLYAAAGFNYVRFHKIKMLDSSFVSWDTLGGKPFGTLDGPVLKCPDYSRDAEGATKTIQGAGVESAVVAYKKFGDVPSHMEMSDFIGCQMLLSDGSVIALTEENFKHIYSGANSYGGMANVFEVADLLLMTDMNFYQSANVDEVTTISVERVGGIFTSNHTGVYVKELRCKPYVKTVDKKYLPLIQPDMKETNPGKQGYIRNNILREEGTKVVPLYNGPAEELAELQLEAGASYVVTIEGREGEYTVMAQSADDLGVPGVVYLGDIGVLFSGTATEGSPTPFCIATDNSTMAMAFLVDPDGNMYADGTINISARSAVHKIDPKYIPALDSITLNGADDKQYKLTVDANGALAVTAIE